MEVTAIAYMGKFDGSAVLKVLLNAFPSFLDSRNRYGKPNLIFERRDLWMHRYDPS
jgi:hypothetical protein